MKGQNTISFLHLSADTELTAIHRFKKKMWKSQLPNPSIQISRYNNHYISRIDQRAYLHMIHSTCPIYRYQCLISYMRYLRKGKIMQTIVLAQNNEHYCILLHNLLKSKQIQWSSNIYKHTHLRKGFGVPMSTILQKTKEISREAYARISPQSDIQHNFRVKA